MLFVVAPVEEQAIHPLRAPSHIKRDGHWACEKEDRAERRNAIYVEDIISAPNRLQRGDENAPPWQHAETLDITSHEPLSQNITGRGPLVGILIVILPLPYQAVEASLPLGLFAQDAGYNLPYLIVGVNKEKN